MDRIEMYEALDKLGFMTEHQINEVLDLIFDNFVAKEGPK